MLFDTSRDTLRRQWLEAWRRAQAGAILTPLENSLTQIIADHPEYHRWLENDPQAVHADFAADSPLGNPFLHLSLHLGIREQVATDRPSGIAKLHQQLSRRHGVHEAEHRMLEILAQTLWSAQRDQRPPDEQAYLERLKSLPD